MSRTTAAQTRPPQPPDAPQSSWRNHAAFAAVVFVGVWLGWRIVGDVLVDTAPPPMALRLRPKSPTLLTRTAQARLAAGDRRGALEFARRSLALAPFNETALRVAGMAFDASGVSKRANQVMTLASNWSLRDGETQLWLFQRRLRQGDQASAMAHLDALLRVYPGTEGKVFSVLGAGLRADPAHLAPALATRLKSDPPWRLALFNYFAADPRLVGPALVLESELARSSHPPTAKELTPLLTTLTNAGLYPQAYAALRQLWPSAAQTGFPVNGRFAPPHWPQPFEWRLGSGSGGDAEIVLDETKPSRTALHVDTDGFSDMEFARSLLVLEPGRYTLSGQARIAMGDGRLEWTVECPDGRSLVEIPTSGSAGAWTAFSAEFEAPSQGCSGQWLILKSKPGERRSDSSVWYRKLRVAKVDSPRP